MGGVGVSSLGLGLVGWLILKWDRDSLTGGENAAVERLGLSLLALIPLIGADYLMEYLGLPLRVSALGVLFLCWLAISLGRSATGHRVPLINFAALVAAGALAGGTLTLVLALDFAAAFVTFVVILAATLTAVLLTDARTVLSEERSLSLMRYLARTDFADASAFLGGLSGHPLVEGAVMLDDAALDDFARKDLSGLFAAAPVVRRNDTAVRSQTAQELCDHLFARYDATHLLLVGVDPVHLDALNMPSLSASPQSETELMVVARMAQLMAPRAP